VSSQPSEERPYWDVDYDPRDELRVEHAKVVEAVGVYGCASITVVSLLSLIIAAAYFLGR
jgi:hypothetical protein